MVKAVAAGLVILALIIWFFEVVLSQRGLDVTVKEYVG